VKWRDTGFRFSVRARAIVSILVLFILRNLNERTLEGRSRTHTHRIRVKEARFFSRRIVAFHFVSYLHGGRDRRHAATEQGASGFAAHCLEQGAAKRWVGGDKHGDTSYFLVICSGIWYIR
jgi:hypothetical protein